MTKTDLKTYESLSIVTINGYDSKPSPDSPVDVIGDANWFCSGYGQCSDSDGFDPKNAGIIWTDYDTVPGGPWQFTVLIDSNEIEAIEEFAKKNEYDFVDAVEVTEPTNYGDGHAGTVLIMKHPDGWVVMR